MGDALLRLRQEFPGVERGTYLFSSRLGAMPRGAKEAISRYTTDWETAAHDWPSRWPELTQRLSSLLASLLETTPEKLSIYPSLHSAISAASRATLLRVEEPASLSAVSLGGASLLVPYVSHDTGQMIDLAPFAEKAEREGAQLIIEAEQAVGVVPLGVERLDASFVVGSCARWLCGGPGTAFLWSKEARPTEHTPEPPNVAAHLIAEVGLRLLSQARVEEIRKKSLKQTQRLLEGALARGFSVSTPREPERRGGIVSILTPHPKEVFFALKERRFFLDYHPQTGLIVAPHFYNSDDELDALLSQMDDILDRRDYERFRGVTQR